MYSLRTGASVALAVSSLALGSRLITGHTPIVTAVRVQGTHHITRLADVQWRYSPAGLGSAIVSGDPSKPGAEYSMLLKLPAGFWIQPHWHPQAKTVVVLEGTMLMGTGDVVAEHPSDTLGAGSIINVPAGTHHYEGGKSVTVLLLYGTGPLVTNYIATGKGTP